VALILVTDDDGHIREIVRFALEQAGHTVAEAADGAEAWDKLQRQDFDLIVLDVLMPEVDGLELCRRVRARSTVPIVFLSSRDEELDRILGLELGADDYITKPFSPRELVARVKAALRRYEEIRALTQQRGGEPSTASRIIAHAGLNMDPTRHECSFEGAPVVLTVTEFGLLLSLLRQPGRVYSRQQLVEQAYGSDHYISERTVDSHIRRVRQKLQRAGADLIETVYGLGYRMRD
jgi:two-component system OmpR family response regulator